MSYLVDTDVVANALKGRPTETALLTNLSHQGLAVSLITYGEIYDGIYHGRDPQTNERSFHQFLRWVDVISLNRTMMKQFAHIRGHLRRTGQIIPDPDILIAATVLHHELTLVTHNIRHFSRIPNLKLYQASALP